VEHDTNAWEHALYQLSGYLEALPAIDQMNRTELRSPGPLAGLLGEQAPELAHELFGPMLQNAELLGQRTAEMHLALASDHKLPDFKPEAFSAYHQRSAFQSIRNQVARSLTLLNRQQSSLSNASGELARQVLDNEEGFLAVAAGIRDSRLLGPRMRIHGDYHLGQVLFTGRDFVIIDFEGEPAKPLSVRRFKRSPLRDVAGMLRSIDYAAMSAFGSYEAVFNPSRKSRRELALNGAKFWSGWVGARFLSAYLDTAVELYREPPEELAVQLRALLLDKACYELEYELNNRPGWVTVPMRGLVDLLG
jgi:maltose alpha-D-glucosyltransferase/alpha-amylase